MSKRIGNGYFALILTCGWVILNIGFVAITFSYSKGYQSADKEHSTYYADRHQAEENHNKCLNSAPDLNGARECIDSSPATSREAQRAEQDLNAQREMAQWAEGMLWAAWFIGAATLMATVVGVRYIYLTLLATQDMARDTKEIGDMQVAAAREQVSQSIRPWLIVELSGDMVSRDEFFNRLCVPTNNEGRMGLHIITRLVVTNVSSVPATIIGAWYEVSRESPWNTTEFGPPSEIMQDQKIFHTVKPHSEIWIAGNLGAMPKDRVPEEHGLADYLSFNEVGRERLTGTPSHIIGWIKYCDPTGALYLKKFAFQANRCLDTTYMPWGGVERNYEQSLDQEA